MDVKVAGEVTVNVVEASAAVCKPLARSWAVTVAVAPPAADAATVRMPAALTLATAALDVWKLSFAAMRGCNEPSL